ncbi:hypothetical protein C8Q78DRAFT_84534 [Trametes maxima]|nr:hypothetical protein C8Q78DRAFT_84534 [Trametes maxima]
MRGRTTTHLFPLSFASGYQPPATGSLPSQTLPLAINLNPPCRARRHFGSGYAFCLGSSLLYDPSDPSRTPYVRYPRLIMVSTRSAKMAKAKTEGFLQPHASRADETTEQTTIALTERKNNTKKSGPCKICGTVLSRRADLTRHYKYSHLRERPFGCHLCPNRYAQSGSLKNHIDRHFSIKRYMCDMALEKGGFCNKRFNDGSSLARHRREQHKGVTHECPFPECFDRFNKHTRYVETT